ncbi:MAG: penicillin-binding protein activator [Motiliproteus sp.]
MKLLNGGNAALLLLLPLLVIGCSSTPPTPSNAVSAVESQGRELTEVEQLLLQAETAAPLARAQYTLEAAELLLLQQQPEAATNLLTQIDANVLPELQRPRLWLLLAEAASQQQQPQQSLDWLARIENPNLLNPIDRQQFSQLRSTSNRLLGNIEATLFSLFTESETATDEQQQLMSQEIWQLLLQLTPERINDLTQQQNSYLAQGWLELAQFGHSSDQNILQLNQSFNSWLELWKMHPAASNLPTELQLLQQFSPEVPQQIAVLLPQTGRYARPAKAIAEGLLAAHFQLRQEGRQAPQLNFFDSAKIDDLKQFYREAELQQIDLVIGPLDKEKLSQLARLSRLPIPTLALNTVSSATTTLNLYQFGLRNEDEAIQSAEQAWQDGHRVAISLTPATTWGDTIRTTFEQHWIELGGVIAGSERFTGEKDFSEKVSHLVAIDNSEERNRAMAAKLGQELETEPRRRQDIDLVFLTALDKDARQIKPILAFHYASDLPVYATSHLFNGKPDKAAYRDLDRIRFNAMPWVIDAENPLRATLSGYRDDTRSRFGRLYALGADSYKIAPYLSQLQARPDAHLEGQCGELSIDLLGQVSRRQRWILISQGNLLPIN